MTKKYDLLVYIGRFQPIHNAHLNIIKEASELAQQVLVIVGSSNQPRTFKDPFTFDERRDLIKLACNEAHIRSVVIVDRNVNTIYDDAAWAIRVQEIVERYADPDRKIGIIGYSKDPETAFYLKMFPQWDLHEVQHQEILDATHIRNLYFSDNLNMNYLQGVVPNSTLQFLDKFKNTQEYSNILAEDKYIKAYRKKKEVYEYPIIGVTVDSVMIQAGHILLIKRRSIPGKGLWALPGGYFHAETTYKPDGTVHTLADKTPLDGIIRELKEETKIDLPEKVLRGSLVEIKPFCAPGRSLLGRSITFAGHFRLSEGEWNLPKVKGADDALKAKWVPLSSINREQLFDDHFDIIQHFVPSIPVW